MESNPRQKTKVGGLVRLTCGLRGSRNLDGNLVVEKRVLNLKERSNGGFIGAAEE